MKERLKPKLRKPNSRNLLSESKKVTVSVLSVFLLFIFVNTFFYPSFYSNSTSTPRNLQPPKIKVYIYNLPTNFTHGVIHKYPGHQHMQESYLFSDLTRPETERVGSPVVRVLDPDNADLFYVSSQSLTVNSGPPGNSGSGYIEESLVGWLESQEWWRRNNGRDHVIVADDPNSLMGRVKNAVLLVTDFDQVSLVKDVIIPCPHRVDAYEGELGVKERKNLLFLMRNRYRKDGGKVRDLFFKLLDKEDDVVIKHGTVSKENRRVVKEGMYTSKFCLHLAGDTPACRLFDSIASLCVPVIVSDSIELPFEDVIDYRKFCIFLRSDAAVKPGYVVKKLRKVKPEKILKYQKAMKEVRRFFDYTHCNGSVNEIWRQVIQKVCKHPLLFSLVYAENAPTKLPLHEFVVGIAMKACCVLPLRFLFCVLCFTKCFGTYWIWRLAFVQSFDETRALFLSHLSITGIIGGWLLGYLLSTCMILISGGPNKLRRLFTYLRGGAPFNELVRRKGPLFRLAVNTFIVLASNMIFVGAVIFVPVKSGRDVLCLLAASRSPAVTASIHFTGMMLVIRCELNGANNVLSVTAGSSDVTTLTVGYISMAFLGLFYLGIIALFRYAKGFSSIVEAVPSLRRKLLAAMRLGTTVAFLVVATFVISPLIYGWLLDLSTVRMFGKTMSHRVEFLLVSPLASSLVHWVVGVIYMWQSSNFQDLLQEVLRPGVLYFQNDLASASLREFIDESIHKLAWATLLDYADSFFIIVFLSVKLAAWMVPSLFPLDISLSYLYTEIPAGMLAFQICISCIMGHFRIQATMKSLVRCWFTGVGWALGVTNFLLPEENGNGEPDRTANDANRSHEDDEEQSGPDSALIVVPVSIGRVLFCAISRLPITHGIKCNDLYAFVIGSYALWTTITGAKYAIEHVKSKRTSVLLNQIWIAFKSSVLLAIWVFIIPVLIGLLFELFVIVPMRVPIDESPVFLLYQDWALGLILWKIWTRLVMMDMMLPLVGDNWRARFERVREDGFSRLQWLWVLKEILFPIVMKLLTALCVPYVLARGVFPMLAYPLLVNSTVYRFAWIGCLSVGLLCLCGKRCFVWIRNLHKSIRDDRYIVGARLPNFGEEGDSGIRLKRV